MRRSGGLRPQRRRSPWIAASCVGVRREPEMSWLRVGGETGDSPCGRGEGRGPGLGEEPRAGGTKTGSMRPRAQVKDQWREEVPSRKETKWGHMRSKKKGCFLPLLEDLGAEVSHANDGHILRS